MLKTFQPQNDDESNKNKNNEAFLSVKNDKSDIFVHSNKNKQPGPKLDSRPPVYPTFLAAGIVPSNFTGGIMEEESPQIKTSLNDFNKNVRHFSLPIADNNNGSNNLGNVTSTTSNSACVTPLLAPRPVRPVPVSGGKAHIFPMVADSAQFKRSSSAGNLLSNIRKPLSLDRSLSSSHLNIVSSKLIHQKRTSHFTPVGSLANSAENSRSTSPSLLRSSSAHLLGRRVSDEENDTLSTEFDDDAHDGQEEMDETSRKEDNNKEGNDDDGNVIDFGLRNAFSNSNSMDILQRFFQYNNIGPNFDFNLESADTLVQTPDPNGTVPSLFQSNANNSSNKNNDSTGKEGNSRYPHNLEQAIHEEFFGIFASELLGGNDVPPYASDLRANSALLTLADMNLDDSNASLNSEYFQPIHNDPSGDLPSSVNFNFSHDALNIKWLGTTPPTRVENPLCFNTPFVAQQHRNEGIELGLFSPSPPMSLSFSPGSFQELSCSI